MEPHAFTRIVYNAAVVAAMPVWAPYAALHGTRRTRGLDILRQEFGFISSKGFEETADGIWIHAVSAGETVAGVPIVNKVAESLPEASIVFSTTTSAGWQLTRSKMSAPKRFVCFPLDLSFSVKRALAAVRPRVFASVEAEIWPNFLHYAHAAGVRTAVVNGVVTDRTFPRAQRVAFVYRWALSCVDRFCMQTDRDAERIIKLGAPESQVSVTGNTKFDEPFPILADDEKRSLIAEFGFPDSCEILVAGSTNPGEDEPVLDAFVRARESRPSLKLVIAPRQLDHAEMVANLARARGLRVGLRTRRNETSGSEDAVVLDTMGELAKVYAVASVSFVGGTLIPKGGHNLLQPVAQGKPVIFGPHTFKTADVAQMVLDAGVGFRVANERELAGKIVDLLSSPSRLEDISGNAERLIESNRGAADRCARAIVDLYRGETRVAGDR